MNGAGLSAVKGSLRRYASFEVFARVLTDLILVNACYATALIARLLLEISRGKANSAGEQLDAAFQLYSSHWLLLSALTIVVFAASGIPTGGAFYRGNMKPLIILQAVSLTYVLFGFIQYVSLAREWIEPTPRVAMALGWLLTLLTTLGARLWAGVWRVVLEREKPLSPESNRRGPIRRVLVIGGAGYIGSTLCRQLLDQGYKVRVMDMLLYGKESITQLEDDPRFELMVGDSRDIGAVFRAMLGVDAVVHLGELVGDPACSLDEDLTLEINLAATKMLAEAARGYGVKRFIYASSCSVYGAADGVLNERSGLNPVSIYARAKIGCERALLDMSDGDFHPVILRLATVFGYSWRPRFDLVVNLLAAKAAAEGEFTVFGGDQWRPFVHVSDVARAMVRCLDAPIKDVTGQIFNVGTDANNHTIQQIGEMVQRLAPESRLISNGSDQDMRNYKVSFDKIQSQIGFSCHVSVESGIREVLEAVRSGLVEDYRAMRYSNHKTLSTVGQPHLRQRRIPQLYQPESRTAAPSPAPVPLRPVSAA